MPNWVNGSRQCRSRSHSGSPLRRQDFKELRNRLSQPRLSYFVVAHL
jgi:hypothetical protein